MMTRPLTKEQREAELNRLIAEHNLRARGLGPIPSDPDALEWRSREEIEAGVPHHICVDSRQISEAL